MNAKILTVFLILSCFKLISAKTNNKRYDQYGLYKATPKNVDQIRFLQNVEKQKYVDIIFWQQAHKLHENAHFILNPKDEEVFIERTNHFGITVVKLLDNVQEAFDAQTTDLNTTLVQRSKGYTWDTYHSLSEINKWLIEIADAYPTILKLQSIGKSAEGREIYAVEFKRRFTDKVVVEGGIHGNEWIAVEFVMFLINELLKSGQGIASNFKDIANKYSWFLVPVLNPDGYEYNQNVDRMWKEIRRPIDGGFDRMWKKNRRPLDGGFVGVNLDRNFDYSFGKYDSSFDPKDENFCGTTALSEPETLAWTEYVNRQSHSLKFYFSFHSYGQKIVIPYGDTVIHEENFGEMENYAKQAIIQMYRRNRIKYSTGTIYDTLGLKVSGDAASWVKKIHHVRYVFTVMLRDGGKYGYALPKDQIMPTCQETLVGIIEIMIAKPRRLRADMFSSRCESLFENISVSFVVMIVMLLNYLC